MGLDDTICDSVATIVDDVKNYAKSYLEMHPLIKMIAASEMRNINNNHVHMQERKVIYELENALNFDNDFVNKSLKKLDEDLRNAIEPIVSVTLTKLFNNQLNKIDLSYLEVDNSLVDFYYGRINSNEADKLSGEMISRLTFNTQDKPNVE